MRYCILLHTVVILYCILVKGSLASSSFGGDLAGHHSNGHRVLLQSGNTNPLLEYNPVFDAAVELQALTALYEAMGGQFWTYDSYFSTKLSSSSGNNTAVDFLAQRFQQRAWLDASVSYCQWYGVSCCPSTPSILAGGCSNPFVQSVAVLELTDFNLSGSVPPEIGDFTSLSALTLSNNPGLTGMLPDSIQRTALTLLHTTNSSMCFVQDCSDPGVQPLPGYLSPGPSANSFNSTDSQHHGISCYQIKLHTRQGPPPAWFQQAAMDPCSYNYAFCSCSGNYHLQTYKTTTNATGARCEVDDSTKSKLLLAGIVLAGVVLLALLFAAIMLWRYRSKMGHDVTRLGAAAGKRRYPPGMVPGQENEEITLVQSDIEGSTEIWEWDSQVMQRALDTHDTVLRALLARYYGYEVTTEGDSFTMAFHDPVDAVRYCLHVQQRLLKEQWPIKLAEHHMARTVSIGDLEGNGPGGQVLFNGLRVRMAINTGVPARVRTHDVTKQVEYIGDVQNLVEKLSDLPAGGQVLMGPLTYQRIYSRLEEFRIHCLQKSYEQPARAGHLSRGGRSASARRRMSGVLYSVWRAMKELGTPSASLSFTSRKTSSSSTHDYHMHHATPEGGVSVTARLQSIIPNRNSSRVAPHGQDSMHGLGGGRPPFRGQREESHHFFAPTQSDNTIPMLIDMGFHKIDGVQLPEAVPTGWYMPGIQVMQILAHPLQQRSRVFPRLPSHSQVYPGFFDAPGSSCALTSDCKRPDRMHKQAVTIAFCSADKYKDLAARDSEVGEIALALYCATVRATLFVCKGYECQEKEGVFMTAFPGPIKALEWAVTLQMALLRVAWPAVMKGWEQWHDVYSADGQLLFAGLRAKVSVFHGQMTRIVPHTTTGRADYFGLAVNRAARFLGAACGGQVLAERGLVEEVVQYWHSLVYKRTMMAFSPEGTQPLTPFLPGSLVDARLGFHMCKASDPFSGSGSRSSSSTHTGPGKSSDPQSLASLTPAKSNTGAPRPSADVALGAASSPGSALGYLRTASLPHVPTQPLLAPGLSQQSETPAMAHPRSKGLNRKTVSFLMTDSDAHRYLVRELKQPVPPVQPRAERGFIRSHFPHLRLGSQGDKKQRKDSISMHVASPGSASFNLSHENSSTCASEGDDSPNGDSLSSVLLANAQPLSHRLGSLDRPAALQNTSLRMSSRYASRGLLDNGGGICDFGPADADIEALLDFEKQDLLPMIKTEDGSVLLPKGPRWPQPRRRSSLINNPLAMQLADSLVHKSEHATRAEQYSPPLAYGSALVSELRQDDESFFSDKSGVESEAPSLAAALGARRSSVLTTTPSALSTTDSISSKRNRRPVSRHVSHIGYSQPNKVLSRLRRSSNGDDEIYPVKMRRRSDETSMLLPGADHAGMSRRSSGVMGNPDLQLRTDSLGLTPLLAPLSPLPLFKVAPQPQHGLPSRTPPSPGGSGNGLPAMAIEVAAFDCSSSNDSVSTMTGRHDSKLIGLVRPMERPPGTPGSPRLHSREASSPEVKRNRWAAAAQAVLNPTLQKEQGFPNSMGRSHFPRRPVTVDVYSIGMFKFKGVMGMYNVVQIMPSLLADRNEHIPASLPRGKATCVTRDIEKLSTITVMCNSSTVGFSTIQSMLC
ncbi:hypothetical protein ABBQ38_009004 [Trebouxia sp. C0009 RCD-2024]